MNKWARHFEWNGASAAPAAGKFAPPAHQYFAFLSYSHRDSGEADWLHSQLERFRVPSSLAGKLTPHGVIPPRLTPIFRDRHELAAGDDLGSEIREALQASHCLIVLCSPAAASSSWTNAEIELFKRLHPDGCVLAAVIGGEPFASEIEGREAEECFPPALRKKYDRRGRRTKQRAEPLAADLREGRDGRRLGFLKIVAGMLGVGLDDLVQRESTRRQRRLAAVAAASIAGMAITSTLAVAAIQARDEAWEERREAEDIVGFMLGDLREKLQPIGRLDALDAVGARALAYFERQDKAQLSDEALAQRSRALTLLGEIAQKRGDLEGALRRYREAMAGTGEMVRREPGNGERIYDHAQNAFWVGYIHYQRGQLDEAVYAFRSYKSLAAQLVALEGAHKEWQLEPIYADNNLGIALLEQKRYREATAAFQEVLSNIEALMATEPDNRAYQDQLSEALAWLSQSLENEGAIDQALGHRERQLSLLQRQASSSGVDAPMKLKMLASHRALGRLLSQRGDVPQAMKHFDESVRIADQLAATEPNNTEWAEKRAGTYFDLAELQLARQEVGDAGVSTRVGCDVATRLAAKDPTVVEWRVRLRSWCLSMRTRLALARGAPEEAQALASQALTLAHRESKQPPLAESRFRLASALLLRGQAAHASGDKQLAQRAWRAALVAWPVGVELSPANLVSRATLLDGLGRRAEASVIAAQLQSMGYRHPGFMRG